MMFSLVSAGGCKQCCASGTGAQLLSTHHDDNGRPGGPRTVLCRASPTVRAAPLQPRGWWHRGCRGGVCNVVAVLLRLAGVQVVQGLQRSGWCVLVGVSMYRPST
jgi:hypothetical protein